MTDTLRDEAASPDRPDQAPSSVFLRHVQGHGLLPDDACARATRAAAAHGDRVDRVLTRLGLMSEDGVGEAWAAILSRPFLGETEMLAAEPRPGPLRPEFLRGHLLLPLAGGDGTTVLLQGDPLDDDAARAAAFALPGPLRRAVAAPGAILAALERLAASATIGKDADAQAEIDVERLRDLSSDAPVVQWVGGLIDQAVAAGASDIHIDPAGAGLRVRLRVDGLLRLVDPPPLGIREAAISRIKIIAGLDIAERRLPQDGRARMTVRGREIDLRIATAPTAESETVVIRVLDGMGGAVGFADLGFSPAVLPRLRGLFAAPRGIVLVTGPTGSGKTTTLYAALSALADDRKKLMTIEDPVEYVLPGVTQIQANAGIGLPFARVLRALLRHNPDIVMLGEIRDAETAETAIEAALTGHPVLSTLHTNSAAGAVTRLLEMGIAPYLVAAALSGVVAQRLVRRICPNCAGSGCQACRGEGTKGRIAVAEVLRVTADMREAILAGAAESVIQGIALADGMVCLADDAQSHARAGTVLPADARLSVGEG